MGRKKITVLRDDFRIGLNTTLDDAIADLQKIKDEHITEEVTSHEIDLADIVGNVCYLTVTTYRDETDEEYAERLAEEEKRRQHQQAIIDRQANTVSYTKDEEYEVYLRLKEKYEN